MLAPTFLAIALAAGAQNPAPAAEVPHTSGDSSLDRIRERLSHTSWLRISPDRDLPEPMFRVEIHEHPYYTERPFVWTFAGGGYPLTAPGIERMGGSGLPKSFGGTDVLPMFTSLKRALDTRTAKAEVQKALEEFCATHTCVTPR